jgi:hypothetical protein
MLTGRVNPFNPGHAAVRRDRQATRAAINPEVEGLRSILRRDLRATIHTD